MFFKIFFFIPISYFIYTNFLFLFLYSTNRKIALFLIEIRRHESSRWVSFRRETHAFSAALSLFLSHSLPFSLSSDHTIIVSTTREINLSSSAPFSPDHSHLSRLMCPLPPFSLFLSPFLSLARTPSLACKHAYKHALAHADTQKCPTNTHSRNFSELRYLDKNITAV